MIGGETVNEHPLPAYLEATLHKSRHALVNLATIEQLNPAQVKDRSAGGARRSDVCYVSSRILAESVGT